MEALVLWLQNTLSKQESLVFHVSEFVCDFIHDDDGRWWFLQLKGFDINPASRLRCNTWFKFRQDGNVRALLHKRHQDRVITRKKLEAERGLKCKTCGLNFEDGQTIDIEVADDGDEEDEDEDGDGDRNGHGAVGSGSGPISPSQAVRMPRKPKKPSPALGTIKPEGLPGTGGWKLYPPAGQAGQAGQGGFAAEKSSDPITQANDSSLAFGSTSASPATTNPNHNHNPSVAKAKKAATTPQTTSSKSVALRNVPAFGYHLSRKMACRLSEILETMTFGLRNSVEQSLRSRQTCPRRAPSRTS
jgi:hypothetical protein